MPKLKIYISGPITGLPYDEVERHFERAKRDLAKADFEPVSPLENGLPPEASWEAHMQRDLEILSTCDGIYLLRGWEKSKGAQIEVNFALSCPKIKYFIKEDTNTAKNVEKCTQKVT